MRPRDPRAARNHGNDRGPPRDLRIGGDPAIEGRADDRTREVAVAHLHQPSSAQSRHAGAAAGAGRRAVDLAGVHHDGVGPGERAVDALERPGELAERNMAPIGVLRVGETELRVLTMPTAKRLLEDQGVSLISYRDLIATETVHNT